MLQINESDRNTPGNDHVFKYDSALCCVVMEIFGYTNSQQFRALTEELLCLIKRHKVKKILADTTDMMIIGASDQQWFIENWFPRAVEAGFKACAMINSRYFFNRIAVANIAQKINKNIFKLELFDQQEPAKQWLRKMD